MHHLKRIKYIKKTIAYFPELHKDLKHGFSWGKNSENMSFDFGKTAEVKKHLKKFFKDLEIGNLYESYNIKAEHKDKIVFLNNKNIHNFPPCPNGRTVSCDALFTNLPGIPITAKPADCTTAIIYAEKNNNEKIAGIIHSGRRGTEMQLPIKAINFLVKNLRIPLRKINIGIIPYLFQMSRRFENINELNENLWETYVIKKNSFFYPDETGFAVDQYLSTGIDPDNFYIYDIDTFESARNNECFSFKFAYEMKKAGKAVEEGRLIVACMLK